MKSHQPEQERETVVQDFILEAESKQMPREGDYIKISASQWFLLKKKYENK